MHLFAIAVTTAVLLPSAMGLAHAQPQKMRPGLWEHSMTMKSQSGQMEAAMAEMQKSLASMPPAQRKQMEQMMAQQGVGMGPKGQTVKVCVTQEQADRDTVPQQEGCTQKVQRINASTMKVAFSCKGGQGQPPSSGVGMGPKGQTVKVCVTQEQADRDTVPQQEGCTQKVQRINASTMKVAFSCKGGQGQPPSSGEGTVSMQGPTAYTGQFKIKTENEGKPEQIDMAQSGKWLSDNCGAIKPVPMGR